MRVRSLSLHDNSYCAQPRCWQAPGLSALRCELGWSLSANGTH